MVTIHLFIEGGGINSQNELLPSKFLNAHNLLRQAFTILFTRMLNQQVKTNVSLIGAVQNEKKLNIGSDGFYWRDLDKDPSKKEDVRKNVLQNIGHDNESHVYFFVQEVEAWIISQLDAINPTLYEIDRKIVHHSILKKYKHASEIEKPSDKLITLSKLFIKEKRKPTEKFTYKKLQNSHEFIQVLDTARLIQDFEDAAQFYNYFGCKIGLG